MWLNALAYFDKGSEKEDEYTSVLQSLGLEDERDLADISFKTPVRLRIDAICEIVQTRIDNITQVTMDSGSYYLIEKTFEEVSIVIDEHYLG